MLRNLKNPSRPRNTALLLILALLVCCPSFSQNATGIISAPRLIDWSAAGASIVNRTIQCASLSPAAGVDQGAQINAAIANCPSGVVLLAAGTYQINTGLIFNNKSAVTLRGAGPDQTFLQFVNVSSNPCGNAGGDVCIINADPDCGGCNGGTSNLANWTSGYAVGTNSITLDNTANMRPGTLLHLDQLDDANVDTGQIWNCQTANVCSQQDGSQNGRPGRGQDQTVTVQSISGTGPWTVTFTPGLYMPNWNPSKVPQAWWSNSSPVTGDGIENLSMDHTNSSTNAAGTFIYNASNVWMKNVRDLVSQHKHVWMYQSVHITVRDSYFYGSANASSESYGVDNYTTSDNLIENNIFQHIAQSMMTEGCMGCVFGHNFTFDDFYNAGGSDPNWQEPSSWHHSVGDAYILWEGNSGAGFIADDIHGTSHFLTLFRNYWTGFDAAQTGAQTKNEQTTPIILEAYQRYFNIIGNVLGKPGYHTVYQVVPASASDAVDHTAAANAAIYSLGFSGNEGTILPPPSPSVASVPNDILEVPTLMRWGNYDTVNGAARFVAAEVPVALSPYPNSLPASQALPPSFYLAAKPSWWNGNIPWPAIGPDVSGGPGPGGHAFANPAQACYQSISATGTAPFTFNANTCYAAATPPAPPTMLQATAQ